MASAIPSGCARDARSIRAKKSAAGEFPAQRGMAAFIKCREPDSAAVRYVIGADQGTKASPCRGAIAAVREA
jgi:hypothetical protein